MKSFAIIRAENSGKVNVALRDLVRYGHMSFDDSPKRMDPQIADKLLVDVMKTPLRNACRFAAVVPLEDQASVAIGRLKKIHPPAHVIIVSPRHAIYSHLEKNINEIPKIDLRLQEKDEDFD